MVAAALLVVSAPAMATGPGKNGQIIYEGPGGVVVADANGANPAVVLNNSSAYSPTWSPDGTRFAVTISGDIWTYDAVGGNAIQVTSGAAYDESPSWSPDGTRIVFGREATDRESIYAANADGTGTPKKLSKPAAGKYDFSPAWSPDGRLIAFNRDKSHGHQSYDIWVMNADGTKPALWLKNNLFNAYPAWSPDSKRLAYEQRVGFVTVLVSRPIGGGAAKQLTTTTAYEPEYSPDGKTILFQDKQGKIRRVPANGGATTVVVSAGYAPGWQPTCDKTAAPGGGQLLGTAKNELLCGLDGADEIHAGGGNDHVFGGVGADSLIGDGGNDVLVGGPDDDTFDGGPGTDTCVQGLGSGTKAACEH